MGNDKRITSPEFTDDELFACYAYLLGKNKVGDMDYMVLDLLSDHFGADGIREQKYKMMDITRALYRIAKTRAND